VCIVQYIPVSLLLLALLHPSVWSVCQSLYQIARTTRKDIYLYWYDWSQGILLHSSKLAEMVNSSNKCVQCRGILSLDWYYHFHEKRSLEMTVYRWEGFFFYDFVLPDEGNGWDFYLRTWNNLPSLSDATKW